MSIGERLQIVCSQRSFFQNAIERGNRLQACSIPRVANGYGVPGLEPLNRMVGFETRDESDFSCFVSVGKRAGSR